MTNNVIYIAGETPLGGDVQISGYKHSAVLLTNAALLCEKGITTLSFVPDLKDLRILAYLVEMLGGGCQFVNQQMLVDASRISAPALPLDLLQAVHGTAYLIPVLLARIGHVPLFNPGGCQIGNRSSNHILNILIRMGASHDADSNQLIAPDGLHGAEIDLSNHYPYHERSGCTKAALLAGVIARDSTVIIAPYLRREVYDLILFLQSAGADITLSQDSILIKGRGSLSGTSFELPADILEWATLVLAVASAGGGSITMHPLPPLADFQAELSALTSCGIQVTAKDSRCNVYVPSSLSPIEVTCPPVISDLQPLLACVLWRANGTSVVIDREWSDRFGYALGLQSLGARLELSGDALRIHGPSVLRSTSLQASDLRAAAGLLIAALGAKGVSQLGGIAHLERGYEDLLGKLRRLGAVISLKARE